MQGLIGGCTSYAEQSLEDIKKDLNGWIAYADMTREKISEARQHVIDNDYWKNVGFDFKCTVNSTIQYCNTISADLKRVIEVINSGLIGQREINLLTKIGEKASEYNCYTYPTTYKGENEYWHDYDNPLFWEVEQMYADGRDFFVTLQDASNAANRLKDYMIDSRVINNNISISGNVSNSGIIQGENNRINLESGYNSAEIMDVLKTIQEYTNNIMFDREFGENSESIRALITETIKELKEQNNVNNIRDNIVKIKRFAESISCGVISSGIVKLLETF